jgi:hypothetical protein
MGFWESMKDGFNDHAPAIFAGLGISGWLTATVLAVKATPKAMEDIEQKKLEEGHENLTVAQTIQASWKRYIWAALSGAAGTGFMIASVSEGNKRYASLAGAYDIAMNGIREYSQYKAAVQQVVGPKQADEIYKQSIQNQVQQNPPTPENTANVPTTNNRSSVASTDAIEGSSPKPICYIPAFGRYIYLTYDEAAAAVNKLGQDILGGVGGYASMNDFFYEVKAGPIDFGEYLGWSIETGVPKIVDKDMVRYTGTPNGTPCWVLEFTNPPQYEYKFFRQ